MKYTEQKLNDIIIVGISTRVNNRTEAEDKRIAQLWDRFYKENLINKIDNRLSDDIYCVYTSYEGDYTDDYITIIGCAVSNIETDINNSNLVSTIIEKGRYYQFISEGQIPQCVLSTWNHIWNNSYNRAYKADFDVYSEECNDPMNAKVTTYLSIF